MTAVVGILNKQAVAIAADSAVTIGGTDSRKIFNRANKVFTLSKYYPVAIMIYNSATFMSTPWETIIKIYRKSLGKKSFNTLREYQIDFIRFLKKKSYYSTIEDQRVFLKSFASSVIDIVVNEGVKKNKPLIDNPTSQNKDLLVNAIDGIAQAYISTWISATDFCDEMKDLSKSEFNNASSGLFDEIFDASFVQHGYTPTPSLKDNLKELVFIQVKAKKELNTFTGVIFTGFGENEIYPALIPVNISFAICGRLRYYIDTNKQSQISNNNEGEICPFAQTDVIETILTGVDPTLDKIYLNNFEAIFVKYNAEILKIIGTSNPAAVAQINGLDIKSLVKEYDAKNLETKQSNYIFPLMNAVSNLSKEDLAEMAESLIYLTYLKRRITFAEESVGGPVDVAVISKGDGFIWMKRKHYFQPELNKHFFDNY